MDPTINNNQINPANLQSDAKSAAKPPPSVETPDVDMAQHAVQSVQNVQKESIPQISIRRPADFSTNPSYVQKMTKLVITNPDFSAKAPRVNIPADLETQLTPDQLAQLKGACLKEFKEAQGKLETSVMEVAISHPDTMDAAKELDRRVFVFIEKWAEVLLEREGVISASTNAEAKQALIDLKVNQLLVDQFSNTRSGIQEGFRIEAGNIGTNPLSIRHVLADGNLRERMYIPYRTIWGFTNEIFKDQSNIAAINAKLSGWKVDVEWFNQWKQAVEASGQNVQYPFQYGSYADRTKPDNLRIAHTERQREDIARQQNVPIADSAGKEVPRNIPLSDREKRFLTGELTPEGRSLDQNTQKAYADRASSPESKPQWQSGSAWFEAPTTSHVQHPYVSGQEALGLPGIAGISGTTDQFMTTALFLGVNTKADLEKLRLACLGWLIEAQDHSYHEIMTASKAYGLEYDPSPTSYSQIYPNDVDFVDKLKAAQSAHHAEMPDFYLTEDHVRAKAKSLGFTQ